MRESGPILLAALQLLAVGAHAEGDWTQPFDETGTIRIVTLDADGATRDMPVWCVVLDGAAWVRTNDSRWLANIRRGSPIELRAAGLELPVTAEEVEDPALLARVEEAFKAKYGLIQRVMSFFRMSEPEVLRLVPAA